MINRKHNYTSIEQYKDDDGRVKITPEVMKLLAACCLFPAARNLDLYFINLPYLD